ncbi:MAG TPA: YdcF family protein [Ohtaekwangia sp.]|nr:YdcF family protein [Ohtaekwangia sp.]
MFFILSKTLSHLVMPVTIVFILWLMAAFLKNVRWKKICFWSALGLFFFFSNGFIANEVMLWWEIKTVPYDQMKPREMGIVLTGATIPLLQPDDRVYFGRGADRVTHTVQLYKLGLIQKILISGGSGSLYDVDEPEANKFKKAMVMMGVPENDIMIENETRNTHESAAAVKQMLDSLGYRAENCLLITSAFHMRRSLACYRKVGLAIAPFATDYYANIRSYHVDSFIIPKLEALTIWHKLVKEWTGLLAYRMAGYV